MLIGYHLQSEGCDAPHAIYTILPPEGVSTSKAWILHRTTSFATDLTAKLSIHYISDAKQLHHATTAVMVHRPCPFTNKWVHTLTSINKPKITHLDQFEYWHFLES